MGLRHWAHGPFELLCHAEGHLRAGEDFDRRIALISFDNSIEVSITTFLTLNPMLRGGRSYPRSAVDTWLNNYHSKLTFLEDELRSRSLLWGVSKEDIVWAHDHRNEQYHGGGNGTPEKRVLSVIRGAAFWVFGVLFDVADVEREVVDALATQQPKPTPTRDDQIDRLLDDKHGMVEVAGRLYYTSEVLFALDPVAYRDPSAVREDDE
jgi:hypothetical protein